ncbi:hypothetical protein BX616_008331 [Lobosporangium transversale]|uniref:Uncharacterized protein n=1 Tax=Lobosporangium transversale TaxID=64571 RepID=A0A1Y2GWQ1_9FUNG|nr:hypothetical protein BCR41DRAFT_393338 [Lobosporangium transversale]KAF9919313.1 hypothetical protein BX616_008331 [Lobosporangium transversale]ORZ26730.1 hypothetical protein BCR41DRAFT_393338 [Lobosporangium transversale]|eukprot:XP_021884493.1 hypothetical protein BCR41DRAFT_393338 [Lobosporangium transversale]
MAPLRGTSMLGAAALSRPWSPKSNPYDELFETYSGREHKPGPSSGRMKLVHFKNLDRQDRSFKPGAGHSSRKRGGYRSSESSPIIGARLNVLLLRSRRQVQDDAAPLPG